MKKVYWEILGSALLVLGGTFLVYGQLKGSTYFWDAQVIWSVILIIGWMVVAAGYYHQGWMVYKGHTAIHVSAILPSAVFFVQCVLFIKGIFFHDWSLIAGALIVNSGVVFSLYQIIKAKKKIP